jgi:hypothetical protein
METGKHINFIPDEPNKKTLVWRVENKYDGVLLGIIAWFCKWRCYGFFVAPDTVFEKTCLRDIANFCENKTKEHKEKANVS